MNRSSNKKFATEAAVNSNHLINQESFKRQIEDKKEVLATNEGFESNRPMLKNHHKYLSGEALVGAYNPQHAKTSSEVPESQNIKFLVPEEIDV